MTVGGNNPFLLSRKLLRCERAAERPAADNATAAHIALETRDYLGND